MNDTENKEAFENAFSARQAAEESYYARMESKKQFYLELSRKMCPGLTPETPDEIRLKELLKKTKRTINMLKYYDCP